MLEQPRCSLFATLRLQRYGCNATVAIRLRCRLLVVRIIIRAVLQWKRVRVDVLAPNQGVAVVPDQTFSAAEVRPELRLPDFVALCPRVDGQLTCTATVAGQLLHLAAARSTACLAIAIGVRHSAARKSLQKKSRKPRSEAENPPSTALARGLPCTATGESRCLCGLKITQRVVITRANTV